jgi:tetratricopeptide (TPR) repeat protein
MCEIDSAEPSLRVLQCVDPSASFRFSVQSRIRASKAGVSLLGPCPLEVQTRDRVPLGWAESQTTLGNALRALGERESGTVHLEEAIAAYHLALKENTRDRVPLDWARTQFNMGHALAALGRRTHNTDLLKKALICFQQAGAVFQAAGMAQQSEASDQMIGRLQDELATGSPVPKPGG